MKRISSAIAAVYFAGRRTVVLKSGPPVAADFVHFVVTVQSNAVSLLLAPANDPVGRPKANSPPMGARLDSQSSRAVLERVDLSDNPNPPHQWVAADEIRSDLAASAISDVMKRPPTAINAAPSRTKIAHEAIE